MRSNSQQWLARQTVLVIIGGHYQRLVRHFARLYPLATMTIVIDAAEEINTSDCDLLQPHLQMFALGYGHTAATLSKGLATHVVDHIKSLGGMAASDGMGQAPLEGRQAGELLVKSADFQRFVTQ